MAVKSARPLLGAGDAGACQDKDGRGVARAQGSACDIGTYEAEELTIGDLVWIDTNGDGDRDDGEPGTQGVTVELVHADGDGRGTATTDMQGAYSFRVLPGKWTVRVTDTGGVVAGYRATTGRSKTADVAVGGERNLAFDFGFQAGSLGDLVWVDTDHDGVKDTTESGLKGVKVSLLQGGATRKSTSTDKSGAYSFTDLAAGDYVIEVTLPEGYVFTSKDSGDDDTVDSDADSSGRTGTISLAAGESDLSWDAGLRRVREDRPPRYEGPDRLGTAVDISRKTFPPDVDVAYVATGANFSDALAGSAASGGRGPILLVTKTAIPGGVIAELKRLKPKRIVRLGGPAAVPKSVEKALAAYTR